VAEIYHRTCNKPLEQVLHDIDRDYYMTAQEAKDYGIIDSIIEDRHALPTPA
jgi:ATP-dependent Clp protease protease subunit